jgi:hypothetical protein
LLDTLLDLKKQLGLATMRIGAGPVVAKSLQAI